MDKWTEKARKALEEAPVRAMAFSKLLKTLRITGVLVDGREEWILRRMKEQPDSFTVIPDRLGPWVRCPGRHESEAPPASWGVGPADPWILACTGSVPGYGTHEGTVARLRESIQAWGRALDDESQVAVARWIRAAQEAERVLGRLLRSGTDWAGTLRSTNRPPRHPHGTKARIRRRRGESSLSPR